MLQHDVYIAPAMDGRDNDPHQDKGITGAEMRWSVSGPQGAAEFVIATQWYPPSVQSEIDAKLQDHEHCRPIPLDLSYHSHKPRFANQRKMAYCRLTKGVCYYMGSQEGAEKLFKDMLTHGSDVIWDVLETYYNRILEGGKGNDKNTTPAD